MEPDRELFFPREQHFLAGSDRYWSPIRNEAGTVYGIGLAKHRDKWRAKLVERFGEEPDISALPYNPPIEVFTLCEGNI